MASNRGVTLGILLLTGTTTYLVVLLLGTSTTAAVAAAEAAAAFAAATTIANPAADVLPACETPWPQLTPNTSQQPIQYKNTPKHAKIMQAHAKTQ